MFNGDMGAMLRHLTKFHNITDEEIEVMATSEFGGLDIEECLMLHLERDLVRSWNFNILEELKKLGDKSVN